MSDFKKLDGTESTFEEWHAVIKSSDREVGRKIIEVDGVDLVVNAYFSGLDGEPQPFEITVDGDPVLHVKYHSHHDHAPTSAECLTKYNTVVTAIEAGDPI